MNKVVPATPEQIARAAEILRGGGLVAFPTETVYGLGADALNPQAVQRIFTAKGRPSWDPLIIHVTGVEMACELAYDVPRALAERFWPGPLTLVLRKRPCVPDCVTAGRPTVAIRAPRHAVAVALLEACGRPIAAPSANRFRRPSPTSAAHVAAELGEEVDLILDGGDTPVGIESTVLDLTQSPPAVLRPGGVSIEELAAVIGPVRLAPAVEDELAVQGLAAPGMSVKHYAPRVPVELFETEAALQARAAQLRRPGILYPQPATLYAQLRQLEAEGVEVILALLPEPVGLGLAVRDRLQRAAGVAPSRAARPLSSTADSPPACGASNG